MSKKKNLTFICNHCNRSFGRKYTLSRHILSIHINPLKTPLKYSLKCPNCSFSSINSLRINDHLSNVHHIELEEIQLTFSSEDEFQQWKESIEIETRSSFSKRTSTRAHGNSNIPTTVYYRCHRSGSSEKPKNGDRKRSQRIKGSCKTGAYCPAHMKRCDTNGKINVIYCGMHIGHSHEIRFLSLPKSVEMLIVKKIQEGVTLDQVLDEFRDEALCSGILEKKHLLNRKSLRNIIYKYDLSSVVNNQDEHATKVISQDTCQSNDSNPIVMYKKFDEPCDNLSAEDMMLVIMTDEQREMLKQFGRDKICIDSTNNSEKLRLQLTSIFILDEFQVPFPACYCISNKVDENTLTTLFQEIKKMVGVIEAKEFMSDDAAYFYNSWKNVMTKVNHRIICTWYIDRAWRKNLDKLGNKEAKFEIYSHLRALLDEPNAQEFEKKLRSLQEELEEKGFHDFKQFFVSTYASRPKAWAACYREEAFLNTSMALESSHKALKHLYSKFCETNQLDVIIQLLLKTIRDKAFNRKIYLNEGRENVFTNEILKRHERARLVKKIYQVHDQEWLVESESKYVKHSVRKKSNNCSCQQKCLVCQVCIHMYTCSCNDYFLSRNVCKHIHAICRSLKSNDHSAVCNLPSDIFEIEIATDTVNEESELYSAEDLFACQLQQIRDLWNNGNGIQIKNADNMRRLIELSGEILNILSDEERSQTSYNISVTKVESIDQTFISVAQPDKLELV